MAGIVFYFENNDTDVWSGRHIDFDAWNYACKIAGDIDSMIVINRTQLELQSPDVTMNFQTVSEMPELEGNLCYLACPWDAAPIHKPITEFDHQNIDWYIFGPASGWHPGDIEVGCVLPQAGRGACHSVHVATAVMFYRYWDSLTWQ